MVYIRSLLSVPRFSANLWHPILGRAKNETKNTTSNQPLESPFDQGCTGSCERPPVFGCGAQRLSTSVPQTLRVL